MRSGSRLFGVALVAAAWVLGGEPQPRALAVDEATQWSVNGHWYRLMSASPAITWSTAKSRAESLGGYLATITSAEEHQWLAQTFSLSNQPKLWLGGSDMAMEGQWQWVTGEPWSWTNWWPGEPNNQNGGPDGNEEVLEMYSSGHWNDVDKGAGNAAYIVEWGLGLPPSDTAPAAPSNLAASVTTGNPITLSWKDNSVDETSFEVERFTGGGAYEVVGVLGMDSTAFVDLGTIPSTSYTYRVRARNSAGASNYSNEASITSSTVAHAPAVPSDLKVVAADRDSVELLWSDNSADEIRFEVHRRVPGGEFEFVAALPANSWSFTHEGLVPDDQWVYGVRAVNAFRTSGFAEVPASTLPTLSVTALRADLKDSPKSGKDSLKVQALFDFLPASPDALFDPLAEGITLRAGDDAHPVVMTLPGGLDTWKVKGTKAIWKSAKGSIPKYMVQVDLEDRLVKASATGLELAAPPANPMRVSVGIGNDAGTVRGDWETKKPGTFRLR